MIKPILHNNEKVKEKTSNKNVLKAKTKKGNLSAIRNTHYSTNFTNLGH